MNKTTRVVGLEELDKAIAQLNAAMERKVTRRALRESAWPITNKAREFARERLHAASGNLFKGIGQQEAKPKRGAGGAVSLAMKIGFTGRAHHGPILEFGTGPRYTKKGKYTGQGRAYRFMTDAWHQMRDKAWEMFKQIALEGLEEEAEKAAKKK